MFKLAIKRLLTVAVMRVILIELHLYLDNKMKCEVANSETRIW